MTLKDVLSFHRPIVEQMLDDNEKNQSHKYFETHQDILGLNATILVWKNTSNKLKVRYQTKYIAIFTKVNGHISNSTY